jgi:SAM-dependent methyltransferase
MSQQYWEERYQAHDMPWEKGAPSPGLVDFLAAHPDLPRGAVGIPGCGTGNDVREFAKAGFDTWGFDLAPSAIALAQTATEAAFGVRGHVRALQLGDMSPSSKAATCRRTPKRAKATALKARFQLADFLHDPPPQKFDWLFEHTLFCAIQPSDRGDYVQAVLRWLKPGGNYLTVNYFDCGPEGPPWPTSRAEQMERFSPHFELLADWTPRSFPNREGRERMFWWTRR